jgi:hypothetical protein
MGRETGATGVSFGRGAHDYPHASGADDPGIIEEGYTQFLSELSELLAGGQNHGKLAAYHGKRRVCIVRSMESIFKECARQSVPFEEVMIEPIQPQPDASQHVFDRLADCEQMNEAAYQALTGV